MARAARPGPYRPAKEEGLNADQARERQEREAVREAEGKGDVEGAGGEDRQLARRLEPRRQEVGLFRVLTLELQARRNDCPKEGRGPQGRQGRGAQVVALGLGLVRGAEVALGT